jgi:hypothetical protein
MFRKLPGWGEAGYGKVAYCEKLDLVCREMGRMRRLVKDVFLNNSAENLQEKILQENARLLHF